MMGRSPGNYRIIEQIGMGGMATIYKTYDPTTDRYVAIKVLAEHYQNPKSWEHFKHEV